MILYRLAHVLDALQLLNLNELFNGKGCNTLAAIEESITHNKQETVCVAVDRDKIVGFCCGQIIKSMCYSDNYAEITELYVSESHRRMGVASGLMEFIETEFRKQGIKHFQVLTGNDNDAAQAFYKSAGYTECSELMLIKIT